MNKLCEVRTISHIRMQVYNVQAVIHAHTAKTHPNVNQVCFFVVDISRHLYTMRNLIQRGCTTVNYSTSEVT